MKKLRLIASYVRLVTCLLLHRKLRQWDNTNVIKVRYQNLLSNHFVFVMMQYLSGNLFRPSHPKYAIKLIFTKDLKLSSKEPKFNSVKQISWLLDAWLGICCWWSRTGNFGSFLDLLQKMLKNPFRKTAFISMYQYHDYWIFCYWKDRLCYFRELLKLMPVAGGKFKIFKKSKKS